MLRAEATSDFEANAPENVNISHFHQIVWCISYKCPVIVLLLIDLDIVKILLNANRF